MKICTLFLILAGAGFAQTAKPEHYLVVFISAERYKDGSAHEKSVYLSGWLDSRLNAGFFGTSTKKINAMRDCIEGKTVTQISAIVDKYVQGHPETWEQPAAIEADEALKEACPTFRQAMDGQ